MMMMTFVSKSRWHEDVHPHESPLSMILPMIVLSVGAATMGILLTRNHVFEHWLEPITGFVEPEPPLPIQTITTITLSVVAIGVLIGIWQNIKIAKVAPVKVSFVVKAARKDLYGDVLNETLLMRPGQGLTKSLNIFDNAVVDGFVNGLGLFVSGISARLRRSETGYVRSYAMSIVLGTALLVIALLMVRI